MTTDNTNKTTAVEGEIDAEEEALAEELGTLVFESTLLQYLAEVEETEAKTFEEYVDKNAGKDDLMEGLCEEFPRFKEILATEMALMQADVKEITAESKN